MRSISEISSCSFGPRPWHIEIRHRVKQKTSTIDLFGLETLKLKIQRLKLWKPTVVLHQAFRARHVRTSGIGGEVRHGVTSGASRKTSVNKHATPHLHREYNLSDTIQASGRACLAPPFRLGPSLGEQAKWEHAHHIIHAITQGSQGSSSTQLAAQGDIYIYIYIQLQYIYIYIYYNIYIILLYTYIYIYIYMYAHGCQTPRRDSVEIQASETSTRFRGALLLTTTNYYYYYYCYYYYYY